MLVGVLCEVVSVVSAVEKEQLTVTYVKEKMTSWFGMSDHDGSHTISKEEFQRLLLIPQAAKTLQEVGVDVISLVDFCDFIFKEKEELTFAEFIDLILSLRGSNQCTVK